MPSPKISTRVLFIDYIPAEVQATKHENWRIVFHCRIPGTEKMKRFRRRVRKMENRRERMRYAKRICAKINEKLAQGWTPFHEPEAGKEYHQLKDVLTTFEQNFLEQERRGQLRTPSRKAYCSQLRMLRNYLKYTGKEDLLAVEFTKPFVSKYLDHVYYKRKRSPRTVNNYLSFCRYLATLMVDRGYLDINSITKIQPLTEKKKKREVIDDHTLKDIFDELKREDPRFLVVCFMTYFCFVRRTEITKLHVRDVLLAKGVVNIPGEAAKNGKSDTVTIPRPMVPYLVNHLKGASGEDFLFSRNELRPGREPVEPKFISDTWSKLRKSMDFKKTYQFYSLKDTGITRLFQLGIPTIKIRDQARHYDITITEKYTPRNYQKDDTIFRLDFDI